MAEKKGDELKGDELKIEGKPGETGGPEEERVTPDVEADFLGLLKDYGVAEKAAKTVTKHIAETGTAEVFEDPRQLLEKMAKFPRHIPPVTRKNILDHWTAARHIPVPEGFEEEAELSAEELRARKGKGITPEKYSVDTDTGAVKVASTTDKALTWDEAVKLSKEIKKDLGEARKAKKKEAEEETGEPPFVAGEEGKWTLNPKGKIGFGEFAVFQMYQESLKRGEPIDPVEELARREESSARLKEAMGVKGGDTEMTVIDKLQKLGILKTGEGDLTDVLGRLDALGLLRKVGDEGGGTEMTVIDKLQKLGILKTGEGDLPDVLGRLDTLGLLRKVGDEGRGTELDILDKLSSLGMLVKPGETESATGQTIRALEVEIKSLRESLTKQEMDTIKGSLVSLSRSLEDLRKEMATSGKLEGRYALMEKTIGTIDGQLSGLRSDAKPLMEMVASGGGPGPRKKGLEERAKIAKTVKEAVALETEARKFEDEVLSGGRQS